MILRPRQQLFVDRCLKALEQHNNTLGVAPTGAGKTIMLSSAVDNLIKDTDAKACILAHRDELTAQNQNKFHRVNPKSTTSVVNAKVKDWSGQTTFAMVQTLNRNLDLMPALDILVIDEAHHAIADSYRKIINKALARNSKLKLFGVTATPNRGDKQGLRKVFNNVADQIKIGELVASGHLVPPKTFVIDVGTQEQLKQVKRTAEDFDMGAVEAIMNKAPIIDAVIKHWREKAGDRQTVVFCSTLNHASNVCEAFQKADITAALVHGDLVSGERAEILSNYACGKIQVIVNVAVLIEGWDHPPTSCVVLLRSSSYKSTMIQMIGRGLRTINADEYPSVVKTDCIILDFGISSLLHGSLEQDINLDTNGEEKAEAPTKKCPECDALVPTSTQECPFCGYIWEREEESGTLNNFIMSEIDLLKSSHFCWIDLFGDNMALIANAFEAWAGIFFLNGCWYAVGGKNHLRLLTSGSRTVCLAAADDWLNNNETDNGAYKSKSWLNQPPTMKQLALLPGEYRMDYGLTRYHASALLKFQFYKSAIKNLIFNFTGNLSMKEAR